MNRTMLSIVALAVGAVLIIGLYNIYSPQVHGMTHDVFDKIHLQRMVGSDAPNSNHANHASDTGQGGSNGQPAQPKYDDNKLWNSGKYKSKDENERAFDWWHDQMKKYHIMHINAGPFYGRKIITASQGYHDTSWERSFNSLDDYSLDNIGNEYVAGHYDSYSDSPQSDLDFTKPYVKSVGHNRNCLTFYLKGDTYSPKKDADYYETQGHPIDPHTKIRTHEHMLFMFE